MNPAILILACASLAGLAWRRRELGAPWVVVGLAGMALLAPALALRHGIPSPAASLGELPPWQGSLDPADGNPALRDVTFQVQPSLLYLKRELLAGRLPFWDPHQFSGVPYWSNSQGAPLFPLHLLFVVLPLQIGFLLLPWLRVVAGGCGAFLLARELEASRQAALVTALVFPLSGMLVSFLLFPMGNALCLVPWVLLAVERLASGRGSWPGLAVAGGLQLLAGHPETAFHTCLIAGVYLALRGGEGGLRAWSGGLRLWGRFAAGWAAAVAIAAVQILPLAFTLVASTRWGLPPVRTSAPLALLAAQPLRLVLPDLYGNPARGTWWGPFNYLATAVYAGALTLPLAAAGVAAARRDRRWAAVGGMALVSLLAAYHLPGIDQALAALPLVGRAPAHRLLFGGELGLALLAAAGCDRWREGRGRGVAVGAGVVAVLLALAWWRFAGDWRAHGLSAHEAVWTAAVALPVLALAATLALSAGGRRRLLPVVTLLLAADLVTAHGRVNPGLSLDRLYPATGAVDFLRGRPGRVAGLGGALHANAALVYGLYDVRGDESIKMRSYEDLFSGFSTPDPLFSRPIERWDHPALDRLGVRWVVADAREPPPVADWRLAYAGPDARVYERPGALALVRWVGGESAPAEAAVGAAEVIARRPGRWEVTWRAEAPGRVVVAESWDAGWRARVGDRPVAIERTEGGALLAVPVAAGSGRLVLSYRPQGIGWGLAGSLAGLAVTGIAWARQRA